MSWKRPNSFERMKPFVDLVQDSETNGGIWLDIGSGDGLFAKILSDKFQLDSVISSDVRKIKGNRSPFVLHSIQNLPFRKLSLKGVVSAQVLHYIPHGEQLECLKKILNSIQEDGSLLIVEYNTDRVYQWLPFPLHFEYITNLISNLNISINMTNLLISDGGRAKYGLCITKS